MHKKRTVNAISATDCMGCKLCECVCPTLAISFRIGADGFWLPSIDETKCVDCGLCFNKCIANPNGEYKVEQHKMREGYAAWAQNTGIRMNSTSGGVFYALAKRIIDDDGYICGCAFTLDYKGAVHIIGNDIETLKRTMRSKYFQSDVGTIYKDIKTILNSGKKVFFVGTPCQTEALSTYLGRDFSNLLICDFICRGVNSPKAYNRFIEGMEHKYKSKIVSVHFKNKTKGWTNLTTHLTFENGRNYYGSRSIDSWVNGYIVGHFYMRECCYNCKYTNTNRYSDITIGDFWGYTGSQTDADYMGMSCVTVNTDKGQKYICEESEDLITVRVDINKIVQGNGCLNNSKIIISAARKEFFKKCDNERFDLLVYRLLGWGFLRRLKRKIDSFKMTMINRSKTQNANKLSRMIVNDMEEYNFGKD